MPEAREAEAEKAAGRPAPHLVPLADGWTLWRTVCLRGTRFPVHMLETLGANDAAAEVDRFLETEAAWDEARDPVIGSCRDATKALGKEVRKPYSRAMRRLTKGRVPEPIPDAPETAPLFETLARRQEYAPAGNPPFSFSGKVGMHNP